MKNLNIKIINKLNDQNKFIYNVIQNNELYTITRKCKLCNKIKEFKNKNKKQTRRYIQDQKRTINTTECLCFNRFKIIQDFCLNKNFELLDTFDFIHTNNFNKESKIKIRFKCKKCETISNKIYDSVQKQIGCKTCGIKKITGVRKKYNSQEYTRQERSNRLNIQNLDISILKDDPLYESYIRDSFNYNIDHIFPRMAFIDFNMDNMFDYDLLKSICNSRENLQILSKSDNVSKRANYNKKDFLMWFSSKIIP